MTQAEALERMMKKMYSSLAWTEEQRTRALASKFKNVIKALTTDLQNLNASIIDDGSYDVDAWRSAKLEYQSFTMIQDYAKKMHVELSSEVTADLEDMFRQSYNRNAWMLDNGTPPAIDIAYQMPTEPLILQMISAPFKGYNFSERLGIITDDMATDIQNSVISSMSNGDSVDDLAQKIRYYTGIPEDETLVTRPDASAALYRATMIAQTELMRASDIARKYFFDQNSDILEGEEWSAKYGAPVGHGKGMVCPECWSYDGVNLKKLGGVRPPAHPWCRCSTAPIVKPVRQLLEDLFDRNGFTGSQKNDAWEDPQYTTSLESIDDYETWAEENLSPYERERMGVGK